MALKKEPQPVKPVLVAYNYTEGHLTSNDRLVLIAVKRREAADRLLYFNIVEQITSTGISYKLTDEENLYLTGKAIVHNVQKRKQTP